MYLFKVLSVKLNDDTEVTYTCRSGMVVSCFYKVNKNSWVTYLQLNHNDPKSTVYLENDGFTYFIKLLELAKTKLQTL